MATDVVMPQMGESITEGTLTKWLKKVGDTVQRDEPLFEISTDKVDAEIPAPIAGTLTEIRAEEGTTVSINTVVAVIGGARAGSAAAPQQPAGTASAQPVAAPAQKTPAAAHSTQAEPASSAATSERLRTSPLVRRMAKEHNLDLRRIAGSGAAGRITKDDVVRFMSEGGAEAAATPVQSAAPPQVVLPGELVPLSRMRAIIAERMVESKRIAPHVHIVYKVDMTRIVRLRDREKGRFAGELKVPLTFMPFIAAATVEALRKFPIVNASFEPGGIRYRSNINLGIAVAVDWGLIVPVVRQAEQLDFLSIARAIADFAERARSKKLLPDEVAGNTFTITNPGVFGAEYGMPIINQPDSAILAVGALKKEPVVLTDAEGNDTIAIRSMQHFCLGFDHRLIDGADAAKFMSEFKRTLENWDKQV